MVVQPVNDSAIIIHLVDSFRFHVQFPQVQKTVNSNAPWQAPPANTVPRPPLTKARGATICNDMKPQVEHAAADFLEDMAHIPDQLLQQPTFRLKRRVKGLYQVVSDLELPVASVLSLKLESPGKPSGALGQALHHPAPGGKHREQLQQQDALHSYTQVISSELRLQE